MDQAPFMKEMSVGEFKKDFSAVLERVRQGEPVAVIYGRKKEVVAVLSPPAPARDRGARRLGRYAGRIRARFKNKWEITEEEFFGIHAASPLEGGGGGEFARG